MQVFYSCLEELFMSSVLRPPADGPDPEAFSCFTDIPWCNIFYSELKICPRKRK